LALTDTTLVYYYSYGSVLAGMSKPGNDNCTRAGNVFSMLHAKYGADPNVMAIVRAGESICSSEAEPPTQSGAQPTGTRTPGATPSASKTPTPPAAITPTPAG
jgi:hypothetical protein